MVDWSGRRSSTATFHCWMVTASWFGSRTCSPVRTESAGFHWVTRKAGTGSDSRYGGCAVPTGFTTGESMFGGFITRLPPDPRKSSPP